MATASGETRGAGDNDTSAGTRSINRAAVLLELIASDDGGFRLTELATQTSLAPATVHRHLVTLENCGFVQHDRRTARWFIGRRAFAVGSAFARRNSLTTCALPYLRQLRDQSKETANLGIADGEEVMLLLQVESRECSRAIAAPGKKAPLLKSGLGKAILASYPNGDIDAMLDRAGRQRATGEHAREFASSLSSIRDQHYAIDNQEYLSGIRCVAAPVFNSMGEVVAAISLSGHVSRMSEDRLASLGKLVRRTALELTIVSGGTPPLIR